MREKSKIVEERRKNLEEFFRKNRHIFEKIARKL